MMNKKLKTSSILLYILGGAVLLSLLFILFGIIIFDIVPDIQTLKYEEYSKQGDNFVYEFESDETYTYLKKIVEEYNKEFGYDTDNKILMGKGKKEIVFAEYDENGITIYCENTVNCKLTNNQIQEYLMWFLDSDLFYDYFDEMHIFVNDLINYHTGISVIMLPMIFETTKADI